MTNQRIVETGRRLRTPRAAAIAGIVFALLSGSVTTIARVSIPADPVASGSWLEENAGRLALALSLVPLSGIAFLWFLGVVRDLLGGLEDRFFATVFFGSGLLYLAMTFMSAALGGALLATYAVAPSQIMDGGVYLFGRLAMYRISNIYAVRMAGVFMMAQATVWTRTRIMPRWMSFLTYAAALTLLVSIGLTLWVTLVFPVWVLVVSIHILVQNLRTETATAVDVEPSAVAE